MRGRLLLAVFEARWPGSTAAMRTRLRNYQRGLHRAQCSARGLDCVEIVERACGGEVELSSLMQ